MTKFFNKLKKPCFGPIFINNTINNTKKLVCNLNDKKNYIVHINVLKQALDHGLKLRKLHRVIEFEQEAWLKEYIDVNMELRKKSN